MSGQPCSPPEFLKALKRTRLPAGLKATLRYLAEEYADWETGGSIFPGNKRLARELGRSERTIIRHTNMAMRLGWLILVHSGQGGASTLASEYQLATPVQSDSQSDISKCHGVTTPTHKDGDLAAFGGTPSQSEAEHEAWASLYDDVLAGKIKPEYSYGEGMRLIPSPEDLKRAMGSYEWLELREPGWYIKDHSVVSTWKLCCPRTRARRDGTEYIYWETAFSWSEDQIREHLADGWEWAITNPTGDHD